MHLIYEDYYIVVKEKEKKKLKWLRPEIDKQCIIIVYCKSTTYYSLVIFINILDEKI